MSIGGPRLDARPPRLRMTWRRTYGPGSWRTSSAALLLGRRFDSAAHLAVAIGNRANQHSPLMGSASRLTYGLRRGRAVAGRSSPCSVVRWTTPALVPPQQPVGIYVGRGSAGSRDAVCGRWPRGG